ncbi:MAG: serine protease inhibitor ecotin [Flavobacteriaceae bacterium]|nr:serine protease inhibitor ecotin [Candidatus Onthonaster equi]
MEKLLFIGILSILSTPIFSQTKEDIKMFPKAEKEQIQKVIRLEPKENENDYMVEIMIGKNTMTDGCNNYFLIGELEEKNLEGWGYSYYEFETKGDVASTLMGCINATPKEKIVYAQPDKVRYNSSLPLVIYAPKGYEIQYRIWSASHNIYNAE